MTAYGDLERELGDGEAMRELSWVIDRIDELANAPYPPELVDAVELTCRNLDALRYSVKRQAEMVTYAVGAQRGARERVELLGRQVTDMAREQRDLMLLGLGPDELAELVRRLSLPR